jgi:hypothetical protein
LFWPGYCQAGIGTYSPIENDWNVAHSNRSFSPFSVSKTGVVRTRFGFHSAERLKRIGPAAFIKALSRQKQRTR